MVAPLTGIDTGGSPISSYHIQYDDASLGVSWFELVGETSNYIQTSYIKTGLQTSKAY